MTKTKLLVVEDDPLVRRAVETYVERYGHEVIGVASRLEEAVSKAESLRPDLVLMDIELEGGDDGIVAARRIQSNRRVPVIYTTSRSDENTLERAKITDPFAYLVKPVREKELAIAIELGLSRHRAEMEKERLIGELKQALGMVKALSGLLPTCSYCKKIRDEKGRWTEMETYITSHSHADFSHSVCPECSAKARESLQ